MKSTPIMLPQIENHLNRKISLIAERMTVQNCQGWEGVNAVWDKYFPFLIKTGPET